MKKVILLGTIFFGLQSPTLATNKKNKVTEAAALGVLFYVASEIIYSYCTQKKDSSVNQKTNISPAQSLENSLKKFSNIPLLPIDYKF